MYGYNSTNDAHWNYLWQLYTMSGVDADRKIIMRAFAQFKEKDKVEQYDKKHDFLRFTLYLPVLPVFLHR